MRCKSRSTPMSRQIANSLRNIGNCNQRRVSARKSLAG
jgi:hypothetical protein